MKLFGHDQAIDTFRAAMNSQKLHHAWLLTGSRGVGKRTFAQMAAQRILAEAAGLDPSSADISVPDDHPTAQLIAAHSHPDFRFLERPPKDKKERAKPLDERDPDAEKARNIPIEMIRGLQPLLASTPSMSDWRAVVIDAADDLEASAANALLKNLEEPPPKTVFLLVSHSPGGLLPTIRSRCRTLRFARLSPDAMASALRQANAGLDSEEIAALAKTGNGAPGRALGHAGLDITSLDTEIADLIAQGDRGNARRAALAQTLSLKAQLPRYQLFLDRAPAAIASHAKTQSGNALVSAIEKWEQARLLASSAPRAALDPQSTVFTLAGMLASLHEPEHG